jgi:hypothetical protein
MGSVRDTPVNAIDAPHRGLQQRVFPTSESSCLGYFSRDSGHKRVPEPPDRTTG